MLKFYRARLMAGLLFFMAVGLLLPGAARAQADLRGWYENGQVWLVWDTQDPAPITYDVYIDDAPITDITQANLIGRIFENEWTAARISYAGFGLTWKVPDGNGGLYRVRWDEGVFAYTPHQKGQAYFAVIAHDQTQVTAQNSIGPIAFDIDSVQAYPQTEGETYTGSDYTLYAYWLDGREDYNDSRPDYPVMASAGANGTPSVFAVAKPLQGMPESGTVPMVVGLCGSGSVSSWFDFVSQIITVVYFDMSLDDAILISMDDSLYVTDKRLLGGTKIVHSPTRWFGYWEGYDRFSVSDSPPPDDAVIVDYTVRKIRWVQNFVAELYNADPHRTSIFGYSGGVSGANYLARQFPDDYSAVLNYVGLYGAWLADSAHSLQGDSTQNLATNIDDGIGYADLQNPALRLNDSDIPFSKYLNGKFDETEDWETKVAPFIELNTQRAGAQFFWDERHHMDHFEEAHWNQSPNLQPQALVRYRNDQSFPAFSNDDQDPEKEGRQPDPGQDRESGDDFGTWGGYFDWDQGSIEDEEELWAMTIFLRSQSEFENDIAPFDSALTDLTIRRAQKFKPTTGTPLDWTLTDPATEQTIASGEINVGPGGEITLEQIPISKTPFRVEIGIGDNPDPGDDDDDDEDIEQDDDQDDDDDRDEQRKSSDDDGACGC